jgi:hypothetical protein
MVRGHLLRARWDPRTERPGKWTGMLYFGFRKLEGLVSANEVLELHHEPDGALQLR